MLPTARLTAVLITATLLLGGCISAEKLSSTQQKMAQTPITDKPSGEVYPGKFIWHDLLTPEPEKVGQFYQALFGWTIDYQEHYAVVLNGDKRIAGIIKAQSADKQAKGGLWIPSVSVADVDASASLVTANGGEILKGPIDMGERGRAVLIRDPQQADLLLLRAKGGDPAAADTAIGDWLWDELWSKDPSDAETFYGAVLGYGKVLKTDDYSVLMRDQKWRAGIRRVHDKIKHLLWVPVVRVADANATARRAKELGGIVWVAPGELPASPNTALIADTSGALLLIQRWSPQATNRETTEGDLSL